VIFILKIVNALSKSVYMLAISFGNPL